MSSFDFEALFNFLKDLFFAFKSLIEKMGFSFGGDAAEE